MREIILKKRYPHSREEDITDAFMRGYEKGKADRPQGEWICHKGRWIDFDYYPTKYECDQCHHYVDVASDKNFCPNCGADMRNSSEKPNNCEHITEDGVTCAKYPACDDCLDNPLNKVKGSERLVKGSEQTDCPWK